MPEQYDLIILGGGPAGLTAGIYGGRGKLRTLILEKGSIGGRAYTTREIVNYPGVPQTSGPELTEIMRQQAERFGVEFRSESIRKLDLNGPRKLVWTRKHEYEAKAVIIATGTQARILGIPGERELTGQGVAYCATCDAEFFRGQHVVVVGSGDQAVEESMYIARFAERITIIVLHDEGALDCNRDSAERALRHPKISFLWNSVLDRVNGEDEVTGVTVRNTRTGEVIELPCQGVFFFVGMVPGTKVLGCQVALDERGYVLTNEQMETSLTGVYAAGDVRQKYLRQISTAVGDGAVAATAAERYIGEMDEFEQKILHAPGEIVLGFWDPDYQEGLERLRTLQEECTHRENTAFMEVDVSRKRMIAGRFGVKLDRGHPAAMVRLSGGCVQEQKTI